ncbi:hypothetical protein M427DRAFT_54047 [Gonapodya prolifera JEL478]|uniref:Calponin-homology (CH) domain-containing protein n=1 Tax=Gonapodya prolifera (strain JEL478) TaxID=1344416 RepID=A0A139ANA5_GONPJ|nr:hypothetical protein M427DRAFT_54047 [Gonapodya prolifera JEL478]|eukprot:KXS18227.1 hypothetical protein M427DRAFT_54047 [Gonapodya prolifera JEL478]
MLSGRDKDRDDGESKKRRGLFAGMFNKKASKEDQQQQQPVHSPQPSHPVPEAYQQYGAEYAQLQRQYAGGWADSQGEQSLGSGASPGFRMPAMAKKNRPTQQYQGHEIYISPEANEYGPPTTMASSSTTPASLPPRAPMSTTSPVQVPTDRAVPQYHPGTQQSPSRGLPAQPQVQLPYGRPPAFTTTPDDAALVTPPPRRPPNLRQLGPPLAALAAQRAHPSPDASSPAHLTPPIPPQLHISQPPSPNFAAFPAVPPSPGTPFLPPAPPPTPTSFRAGSVPPSPVVLPSSMWGSGTPPSSQPGSAASSAPASPARVVPQTRSGSASLASVEEQDEQNEEFFPHMEMGDSSENKEEASKTPTSSSSALPDIRLDSLKIDLGTNFSDLGYFPSTGDSVRQAGTEIKEQKDEVTQIRSVAKLTDERKESSGSIGAASTVSPTANTSPSHVVVESKSALPIGYESQQQVEVTDDLEANNRERRERIARMGGVSMFGGGAPLIGLKRLNSNSGAQEALPVVPVPETVEPTVTGAEAPTEVSRHSAESQESSASQPTLAKGSGSLNTSDDGSFVSSAQHAEPAKKDTEIEERMAKIARIGGVGVMGGLLQSLPSRTMSSTTASQGNDNNVPFSFPISSTLSSTEPTDVQVANPTHDIPKEQIVDDSVVSSTKLEEADEIYDPLDPVEEAKRAREERIARLVKMGKIKVKVDRGVAPTTHLDQGIVTIESQDDHAAVEKEQEPTQDELDNYDPREVVEALRAREERIARLAKMGKIRVVGDAGHSRTPSLEQRIGVKAYPVEQQRGSTNNVPDPRLQPQVVIENALANTVISESAPLPSSAENADAISDPSSLSPVGGDSTGIVKAGDQSADNLETTPEVSPKAAFAGIVPAAEVKGVSKAAAKSRIALKARKHTANTSKKEETPTSDLPNGTEALPQDAVELAPEGESQIKQTSGDLLPTTLASEEQNAESVETADEPKTEDEVARQTLSQEFSAELSDESSKIPTEVSIEDDVEDEEARKTSERKAKLARLGGRNVFGGMGVPMGVLRPKPKPVAGAVEQEEPKEVPSGNSTPSEESLVQVSDLSTKLPSQTRPSKPAVPPKVVPIKRTSSEESVEHEIDTSTYNPNFHLPTRTIGPETEARVVEWIESVVGEQKGERTTQEWLKDGTVLCLLVNGVGGKASMKTGKFRMLQMENIRNYIEATSAMGNKFAKFEPNDLFEGTNMLKVIQHIDAFRVLTSKKSGPPSTGRKPPIKPKPITSPVSSVGSVKEEESVKSVEN